ncbi:MAG TPA: IS110 family transposase [Candidatus Limnocylindrales bacterium]|nr:IS110 family transposase [Candidatus Limnocylindrales bacterium]
MSKAKISSREERVTPVALPVLRPLVAGIDLGSSQHWVCGPAHDDGKANVRVFGTTTAQLHDLADWLVKEGVQSVAMESTYVYWIPVYEVLASRGLQVVLVNARQLHNVPGRKTDFLDCQWIQVLHSCGLLRGSFRPAEAITQMRAMQRQMANLVAEQTRCVQWMQKALDQMNVQVHRAVTDITGTTGMSIIRAIVAGERDPKQLAKYRDQRCRKSVEDIEMHLVGTWREEHLFNLASALRMYDAFGQEIAAYETHLIKALEALQPPERRDQAVPPHPNRAKEKAIRKRNEQELRTGLWRFAGVDLTRIDGISSGSARVVLTELGPDLAGFPSESNFVSWLRLCPRVPISGGKPIKKRRNGLGANRIAGVLRMAATSLRGSKSALGAFYRRHSRHNGADVAVFATARELAKLIYRMLRFGQDYVDVGERAYESRFELRRVASLKEAAKSLGFALIPASPVEAAQG